MEVPYLNNKPKSSRSTWGGSSSSMTSSSREPRCKRTFQLAKKFEGNPVFKAETDLEKKLNNVVYLGQGGVFYEPKEKLFKMFYTAGWRGPLALATSPDLKTWTRPELGLHGGNLLLPEGASWSNGAGTTAGTDNALWYDIHANDPKEAHQIPNLLDACAERPASAGADAQPAGVRWRELVEAAALHDACGRLWLDLLQSVPKEMGAEHQTGWAARTASRYYVESDTFLEGFDWDKAVYWTDADAKDKPEPAGGYAGNPEEGDPPQLYSLAAVAYESLMIGMHQIHRGPNNGVCSKGGFPKLTDLELGFSRDGFHWDRPDRRGFIVGAQGRSLGPGLPAHDDGRLCRA